MSKNKDLSELINYVLLGVTTGSTFVGLSAGNLTGTGTNNTFIGNIAGTSVTTAEYNTAVGRNALSLNLVGVSNVAIGESAGTNYKGSFSTFIGAGAGFYSYTGNYNIGVGRYAVQGNAAGGTTTGSYNSGLGSYTLGNYTTGSYNIAIGHFSLYTLTTGSSNIAIGHYSLTDIVTTSNNTALGYNAGRYISGGVTSNTASSNSIFLGYQTYPLADTQTNQIVIGYEAVGLGSNTTVLGNSSTTDTAIYGNLLLGGTTTGAGYKLDVTGTARVSGAATFSSGVTAGGTNYLINTSTGTAATYQRILNTGGDVIIGLNSSAGTSLASGGLAYAASIYTNTATALQFGTNAAFNMTITSTGNVGIGTSSPDTNLTVYGANVSTANASAIVNVYTTTGYGANVGGSIGLGGYYNTTANITYANIHGKKENATLNDSNGYFAVSVRNATDGTVKRMKITSAGRTLFNGDVWGTEYLGVVIPNTATAGTGVTAYSNSSSYTGSLIRVQSETTGGTGWYGYELRAAGGTLKYGIYGNGTVTAPSDERRKKNIETTRDGYLQDVCNLRVVKYNWKEDEEGKGKELGFIAQEVEKVFPKLVETGYDGMNNENEVKLLKQVVLIPILVKVIQELSAQNTSLINRIETLENK